MFLHRVNKDRLHQKPGDRSTAPVLGTDSVVYSPPSLWNNVLNPLTDRFSNMARCKAFLQTNIIDVVDKLMLWS